MRNAFYVFLKRIVFISLCIVLTAGILSSAENKDLSKKIGIGLGYPYLSLKYGFSPGFTGEIRDAFGSGINIFGGRGYLNFSRAENLIGFVGAELSYISFDTEDTKGNGYLLLPFIGGEIFTSPNFSIGLDIGPGYINVNTEEIGKEFTANGIEWICNLGINYYFGSGASEKQEIRQEIKEETKTPKIVPVPGIEAVPSKEKQSQEQTNYIYIKVTDIEGQPLPKTTIKISRRGHEIMRCLTDENGEYKQMLTFGNYTVKAWKQNYTADEKQVIVVDNIASEVSFILKKK